MMMRRIQHFPLGKDQRERNIENIVRKVSIIYFNGTGKKSLNRDKYPYQLQVFHYPRGTTRRPITDVLLPVFRI